jgi:hypothetical protein
VRNDADAAADQPATAEAMEPALAPIARTISPQDSDLAADSMEGRLRERPVRIVPSATSSSRCAPRLARHPDGTFVQQVPLVGITDQVTASLTINGRTIPLEGGRDYIAESTRVTPEVKVENSELVFVGYGIVAPEYGWDDYKVDVTGKTIVMLVTIPDHAGDTCSTRACSSKVMTYYGAGPQVRDRRREGAPPRSSSTGLGGGIRSCCRGPAQASTSGPRTTTWVA